jgi:TonB family protein
MTRTALLYQPRQKVRMVIAFSAALLIHFAAIAIANVQRVEKAGGPPLPENFSEITFEAPPSEIVEPAPEDPELLPMPPQTEDSFPAEKPTPPPIRRQTSKRIAPLVKPGSNRTAASLSFSSAKVLATYAPRPEYPYEARRQRITGTGTVAMIIDSVSGNVSSVAMSASTGSPFLDNAALTAFRRWRFRPGTVSSVTCPVTFTLTGASY